MRRGERTAVAALASIGAVTVCWWALALWPVPPDTPAWLLRTREVCFGRTESGLPEVDGWMLLVGQPLGMVALLVAGWGRTLRSGLRRLVAGPAGRAAVGTVLALFVVGVGGVAVRVDSALAGARVAGPSPDDLPPATYPEIGRQAPRHVLVDQHGVRRGMPSLEGERVLVTFGFGHCETVCPAVVATASAAREELAARPGSPPWRVAVVTLDPWRDTPSRLASLHERWGLSDDALVLGGEVDEVEAALDAWEVARSRDERTGDVVHPALVYLVDEEGVIRYASTGGVDAIVELARRIEGS